MSRLINNFADMNTGPMVRFIVIAVFVMGAGTSCSRTRPVAEHPSDSRCHAQTLTEQQAEQIALSQLGPEWRQANYVANARQPSNGHWTVLMQPKGAYSPGDEWFELLDFCGKPIGSMASH